MRPSFAVGGLVAAAFVAVLHGLTTPNPDAVRPLSVSQPAERFVPVSADPSVIAARIEAGRDRAPDSWAPPTEHWLGEDGEQRQKSRRKAWMAELHRAGDADLDYKAIDQRNGLAQIAKRNRLAHSPAPPHGEVEPAWIERGSDNNAGRMHVAVHSTDGSALYAGSSRGGIWRRPLDGGPWEPLGDNLYGGAHWLTLYPASDGGADHMLAATDGGLVHRSDDDGATWVRPLGLGTTQRVRRLLQASDGSGVTWMVVGVWTGRAWDHRLVRSTDRGRSFEDLRQIGSFQADLWTARDGSDSTLWLLTDSILYRSDDAGDTWTEEVRLPRTNHGRAELVGSEAGGPRLWIVASGGGRALYRYDVDTRELVTVSVGQDADLGDYWGTLNASLEDPDTFAWGGVEVFRTFDGGGSFSKMNNWGAYYRDPANRLHADNPGMDVWTDGDEEVWYFSTDGGLYESRDGAESVQNLSLDGLRVSQYYDVLTSRLDPSHVAAGAQDQGYQTTQRFETTADEVYDLEQILSGDYGHLTSGDGSHGIVYSVYPGFMLVVLGEEEATLQAYVDFPEDDAHAWLPPIVADPTDPWSVFFCGERLYRYTFDEDAGTWVPEDWAGVSFSAQDGEYLSALAFSPVDPERAWMATNRGRVFTSDDHGRTWEQGESPVLNPHYFYGHALVGSSAYRDVAYLGGNGYQVDPVLRTTDGGRTWEPFSQGLPNTQVYMLAEATDGSGRLFAATQQAAYMTGPDAPAWRDLTGVSAPVTTYWSVEWLEHGVARFGTYGRGIWDYDLDPDRTGCWPGLDVDGDGHDCVYDCNDDDPTIHPGAPESCDGVDSNCDRNDMIEEDADGDGFLACAECDDAVATVYPGAKEIRGNDIDEDCDGEATRRCGCASASVSASGAVLWLALVPLWLRRRRD